MSKLNWLDRELVCAPHLILCGSEEEYLEVMKYLKCKYFDRWLTPGCHGKTHTLESGSKVTCIVCIDFNDAKKETLSCVIGLLVHEAVHVWEVLCDHIGESKPSSEFQAYSIQIIAQRLISDFLERGKWKK